ncbi:VOC family protein [Nosocomiicoccus massiliensis]|uniref:VOC family protein n=1 Tax=Nosocomiicoccus massiliensis TaxID=1232430 RepID=UPI0003FDBB55|nr:VOC family protein [Nosocomiicoccus massiliensis]
MNFHKDNAQVTNITLNIRDLSKMKDFYINILGMKLIEESESGFVAGFEGGTHTFTFEVLENGRVAAQSEAGLFHIAILLPTRSDLGRFIKYMFGRQIPLSGGNHLVSEATYLVDPEGNGIEVYVDRDPDTWSWSNGQVVMDTLALDFDGIIESSRNTEWSGMPEGTIIGHLHLKGGVMIDPEFYGNYGFEIATKVMSAYFLGSNKYHHHIAVNNWHSNKARIDAMNTYGLKSFNISVPDATSETVETPEGIKMVVN